MLKAPNPLPHSTPQGDNEADHGIILGAETPPTHHVLSQVSNGSDSSIIVPSSLPAAAGRSGTRPFVDYVPYALYRQTCSISCMAAASSSLQWIWMGGSDGLIRKCSLWDTMNGQVALPHNLRQNQMDTVIRPAVITTAWGYGSDGAGLVPTGTIQIKTKNVVGWDAAAFETKYGSLIPVHSMAVEKDGKFGLVGLENGVASLSTLRTHEGKCHHVFTVSKTKQPVSCLALEETSFVSGSWDKQILWWDLNTGQQRGLVSQHKGQISAISWNPEHKGIFLSSSIDGGLCVWDVRADGKSGPNAMPQTPSWLLDAIWSSDGRYIYTGRKDASMDCWDVRTLKCLYTRILPQDSGPVTKIKSLPTRDSILCASLDNIRIISRPHDGQAAATRIIPGHHGGSISEMLVSPDGLYMISSSGTRGWEEYSNDCTLFHYAKAM